MLVGREMRPMDFKSNFKSDASDLKLDLKSIEFCAGILDRFKSCNTTVVGEVLLPVIVQYSNDCS